MIQKRSYLVAAIAAILHLLPHASAANNSDRPNILFIIADDQSPFDLKTYDPNSPLETPTINRLSAEGMTFDAAHHMGSFSGAVCMPSRHMVMTGRTLWHLPKRADKKTKKVQGLSDDAPAPNNTKLNTLDGTKYSMAAIFNNAGYDTMRTCKNGNSYEAANAQFTVRQDSTKRGGTEETGSAWHGKRVLEYLDTREASNDQDPFLIYFGFSHPHDTRDGTPELLRKYGATNHTDPNTLPRLNPETPAPPLQTNYLPAHPFHHGQPGLRDEEKVSGVWKNRDEATIRNELGRQYACSENIDIQIDSVLKKLEAMGELDNTYIIYTADHGMAIGRHGLQGKQNLYEHTWRVPFIIKGPGIEAGVRAPGNFYLLDVLPTLCDIAGIKKPDTIEGISFKPILDGNQKTIRDVLFGTYCGGTKPGMRTVKTGDWKLIKYDTLDGSVRKTQLFNLADNPDELLQEHHNPKVIALTKNKPKNKQVNLASNPRYAKKLKQMEELLLAQMIEHQDPYRLWDQPSE